MLDDDELWLMEDLSGDDLSADDPSELLSAMPELKQYIAPDHDEEEGLRSLLERPELLAQAWRHVVRHAA